MSYYRLVSKTEIESIIEKGYLEKSKNLYSPYKAGDVVCVFDSQDIGIIFKNYGEAIAETRDLQLSDKLYALEIIHPKCKIETDKSQVGWEGSKVHFGDIVIDNLRIVGCMEVKERKEGWIKFKEPEIYDIPKDLTFIQ